jgi:hypothetical protein
VNPWWIGVGVGGALIVVGVVFAAGRVAAAGGAEVTVLGTTVKTGNTAALALLAGLAFMGYSIFKLAETPTADSRSVDPKIERFGAEVGPLLDESRTTLNDIGQVSRKMKAARSKDAISGTDLESKLQIVILSREGSLRDAENLQAPPQALEAKDSLEEAFELSLEYDRKLQECRSYGIDHGIGKGYRSCLDDVDTLGVEATETKNQFFRQLQKALRRPLGDTSLF